MSAKMRLLRNVLIMATLLLVTAFVLTLGSCCKPDASGSHRHVSAAASDGGCCAPGAQVASHESALAGTSNDTAAPVVQPALAHDHASADQPQATVALAEQTTCPVRGGAIDKSIFTEYQGKKVYFCCQGCVAEFQKDPEKYIAKPPQFAP